LKTLSRIEEIVAADLFCGAGGSSAGIHAACKEKELGLNLVAVNHWDLAISSHTVNHPAAAHYCANIEAINPRDVVPSGYLNLLWGSPECTHHSNAAGGRPKNDQSRASAWLILKWLQELYVENLVLENVREFVGWGPLDKHGRPIKKLKGQTFMAFLEAIRSLNFSVEYKILNAADYGDPQTRIRCYVIARNNNKPIRWPEPTHCDRKLIDKKNSGMFGQVLKPWVPAREIIDWTIKGKSIFGRKKPLAKTTLHRIYAGFEKHGGPNAEPFLIILRNHMESQGIDSPVPTVTAGGNHIGLCVPQIIRYTKGNSVPVDEPLPTQTQNECFGLAESIIVGAGGTEGSGKPKSTNDPLGTVLTHDRRALAQTEICKVDFILPHQVFDLTSADSVDEPMRTIRANSGEENKVVEGTIIPFFGERPGQEPRCHSIDEPIPTVTSHGAGALSEGFILPHDIRNRGIVDSLDEPFRTMVGENSRQFKVAEAFIVETAHGVDATETESQAAQRRSSSIDDPIRTVTASSATQGIVEAYLIMPNGDQVLPMIVTPHGTFNLDITLRMLKPHELAGAFSIPDFTFNGTLEEKVKQIGNAVCREVAKALCLSVLGD